MNERMNSVDQASECLDRASSKPGSADMSHAGDLGTDDKTCHKVLRASVACGLSHMLSVQLV